MIDPRFDCRLCGQNATRTKGAYAQTNEWEIDPETGRALNVVGWCCRGCVRLLDLFWFSYADLQAVTQNRNAPMPEWRPASELPAEGVEA